MSAHALGLPDLVAAMPVASAVLDRWGRVVCSNPKWETVSDDVLFLFTDPGAPADGSDGNDAAEDDAAEGNAAGNAVHNAVRPAYDTPAAVIASVLTGDCSAATVHLDLADDPEAEDPRFVEVRAVPIGDGAGFFLATCTPLDDVAVESSVLADRHTVTGVPGLRLFTELLNQAMAMSGRYPHRPAVLAVAVDGLDHIDSAFGRSVRRSLLVAMASRFRSGLRPSDVVAHPANDRFLVLLPDVDSAEHAHEVAARLCVDHGQPFRVGECRLRVSIRAGVALCEPTTTAAQVIDAATAALAETEPIEPEPIEAESIGTESIGTESIGTESGDTDLAADPVAADSGAAPDESAVVDLTDAAAPPTRRVAVAMAGGWRASARSAARSERHIDLRDMKDEELVSYYQPIFDVADGHVVAGEALMRWRHPHYGVLSAGEFLGLAINSGMLATLTDQALVRATETWADLRDRLGPRPPKLFVNLSPDQLLSRVAVDRLYHLLVATGLPSSDVVVEVTEEAMATRFGEMLSVLNELRTQGLHVALDDFGSGYSSLGRLRHLPVDVIKVDQTMVRGLETDHRARQLLAAVSTMASELDVDCIVEGIETAGEALIVAELGFRFVQGYHFGRPAPAEDLVELVTERQGTPAPRRADCS